MDLEKKGDIHLQGNQKPVAWVGFLLTLFSLVGSRVYISRTIYEEIKAFEEEHGANQSTYWLFFELLWRDFFYFIARKWGARLFHRYGINPDKPNPPKLSDEAESFEKWKLGKTNDDFVNANMNELRCTGWMSNRGGKM